MSPITAEAVRAMVLDEVAPSLRLYDVNHADIADDYDLRASGLVDSLGFLEIIATLERALGVELDFDDMDPAELTVLGPLTRWVAAQASAAGGADAPAAGDEVAAS